MPTPFPKRPTETPTAIPFPKIRPRTAASSSKWRRSTRPNSPQRRSESRGAREALLAGSASLRDRLPVELQGDPQLFDGSVDRFQGLFAVPAEIVIGMLEVALGALECADRFPDLRV